MDGRQIIEEWHNVQTVSLYWPDKLEMLVMQSMGVLIDFSWIKKQLEKGAETFFKNNDCQDFKELPHFSTLKESNTTKAENQGI